jgi:hypothetical protein
LHGIVDIGMQGVQELVQLLGTMASTAVDALCPAFAWWFEVRMGDISADVHHPALLRLLLPAALLIMFFLEYFDMLSGGALGSLTVGLVTCYTWEHGQPKRLSQGPNQNFSAAVERVMAKVGPMHILQDSLLHMHGSCTWSLLQWPARTRLCCDVMPSVTLHMQERMTSVRCCCHVVDML